MELEITQHITDKGLLAQVNEAIQMLNLHEVAYYGTVESDNHSTLLADVVTNTINVTGQLLVIQKELQNRVDEDEEHFGGRL